MTIASYVEDRLAGGIRRLPSRYVAAYLLGVLDGLAQPYEICTSYNVDDICYEKDRYDVHGLLDRGINLGQFLRAGRKSQSYVEFGFLNRKFDGRGP